MTAPITFFLGDFWAHMLVFARFGALLAFLPGFAEATIPWRVRTLMVMGIAFAFAPLVFPTPPLMPEAPSVFFLMIFKEILIGYFLGMTIKILLASLDIAGTIIGFQMGLANAFANSPATSQQSGLSGVFLSLVGVCLLFSMDLHFYLFKIVLESYKTLPPMELADFSFLSNQFVEILLHVVSESFKLGVQLAAPLLLLNLLLQVILGVMNRIMPQLQILFVVQPLQIALGLMVLSLTLFMMFEHFSDVLEDFLNSLLGIGG